MLFREQYLAPQSKISLKFWLIHLDFFLFVGALLLEALTGWACLSLFTVLTTAS